MNSIALSSSERHSHKFARIDYTIIRPDALTPAEVQRWTHIIDNTSRLDSPYFDPQFTQVVASQRDDVFVCVIRKDSVPVGFFPYQKSGKQAWPVGYPLNDFHGVIATDDAFVSPPKLMDAMGLRTWHFTGLVKKSSLKVFSSNTEISPSIDLTDGFTGYQSLLKQAGSSQLKQLARKRRKLERQHGTVTFDPAVTDLVLLKRLVALKRKQYARNGQTDLFTGGRTESLISALLQLESNSPLRPLFSVLRVGDQPIAFHFGMLRRHVCHWWFPAYDVEYANFSPGKLCLLDLLRYLDSQKITRLDLGPGNEPYKLQMANTHTNVHQGTVDLNRYRRASRRLFRQCLLSAKSGPFKGSLQFGARNLRRLSRPLTSRRWDAS